MADETNDQTTKAGDDNVDLSSLSSFSLGPDWVSGNKKSHVPKESFEDDKPDSRGPRRDRRGPMARKRPRFDRDRDRDSSGPRRDRFDREGSGRFERDRPERFEKREPFKPMLAVDFYPEEEPFKVLSQAIKTSCRTFELFEIARLILEKPDRFVCVARDPEHKEGEPARIWACVPDGLPFVSEEEAMTHTFRHYMGEFFTLETVEVDAPSGSFQMIHKCGMTGDLLAPPNYHRYQAICREHHAAKLSHVPYTRFEQRIESTREEEDIKAWITSMKTQTRYILKEDPEQVFRTMEDARLYLITQAKDKLVRPAFSARFSGKSLALLSPGNPVRRSVEYLLEGQKRFPLETANHLRGRLRRMHFAVYKRGSKGVSFVCAVKRHFRKPDEVLADNLQKLVDFIESKPNFPAKDLPKAYLKAEPEGEAAAIKQLKTDLHYLVSQGYVIEYSDGRLFVPPIREDEIRHMEKLKSQETEESKPAEKKVPVKKEQVAESEEKPEAAKAETLQETDTVPEDVSPVEPVPDAAPPEQEPAEEVPAAEEVPVVEEVPAAEEEAQPKVEAVAAEEAAVEEKAEAETDSDSDTDSDTDSDSESDSEAELSKKPVEPEV